MTTIKEPIKNMAAVKRTFAFGTRWTVTYHKGDGEFYSRPRTVGHVQSNAVSMATSHKSEAVRAVIRNKHIGIWSYFDMGDDWDFTDPSRLRTVPDQYGGYREYFPSTQPDYPAPLVGY